MTVREREILRQALQFHAACAKQGKLDYWRRAMDALIVLVKVSR